MDTTFKAVKHTPGIIIWRIEKMDLAVIPEKFHGHFFMGDCYILLHTKKVGNSTSYVIHYWIGSESSQDEQGAAAVYAVQLDRALGSNPIQYREVQGHESATFKGYFKTGVVYEKGGVKSGMKHVETNSYDVKRLLHVKGKRRITAKEVEMSWESFNNGDVFHLDLGDTIVQWNGPKCNTKEKLKGMLFAKDICSRERGGRAAVRIIEGDAEDNSPRLMELMNESLGERSGQLSDGTPDEIADQEQKSQLTLYHVSDDSGKMKVTEVGTRPLVQDLLNHDDCYILDQGGLKVFAWKGKKANTAEREAAMSRALDFIKSKNYPPTTNIEVVNDGAESALFKQLFQKWTVKDQTQGLGKITTRGKVAQIPPEKFDATLLHEMPDVAAQERMVDNGSGDIEMWRIENLELAPVDKKSYGYFYGGDCYLVLYTYQVNNRQCYLLYMWLGQHASQDEVTAMAFQAVDVDQKYGGQPVQIRVTMGKEPKHFMAMYKGKMVIYAGGTSRSDSTEEEPPVRLFQVHGTHPFNTKAVEVQAEASSLNSGDVFLLKSQSALYMWCGKGSSGDERQMAKEVAAAIGQSGSEELVTEGQEPAEFWELLGGKAPYANDKKLHQVIPDHEPRLFECSNKTGRFIVSEIAQFIQDDLSEDDVMLLDTWDQVFLWIGKEANEEERKQALETCQEYLRTHPGDRDPDTPIVLIKQGFEPPTFTGWFTAWDSNKWSDGMSYEELKKELGEEAEPEVVTEEAGEAEASEENYETFPLDALINKQPDELPDGVNPSQREKHLSDSDFSEVFGMSKEEYDGLPQWKQLKLKKAIGLF